MKALVCGGVMVAALLLGGCQMRKELAFSDVSVTLPDDTTALPQGTGADLVTASCTACHSPAMILTQPRLTAAQWKATVEKMQHVFKAPVADKDIPAIVDYLVATNEAVTK